MSFNAKSAAVLTGSAAALYVKVKIGFLYFISTSSTIVFFLMR